MFKREIKMTSIKELKEWTDGHSKEFEVISQIRDTDAGMTNRALEIVKKFIIERDLILYGGQAIDFALRLKGSQIYPAHQTPDFDFFSPQNVDDAYDLADILKEAGFISPGAIPAIHVQTMRVKTDFIFVADISYAPRKVFDNLPTITYSGMRVLHPDYQRMDMHLAFCFPFNNPPREDVFHRFPKDLKRFHLFQEYYPIIEEKCKIEYIKKPKEIDVDLSKSAIHGFAAYGIFRSAFDFLEESAKKIGIDTSQSRKIVDKTPDIEISLRHIENHNYQIKFKPPSISDRLILATPYMDDIKPQEWYAPYMDARPLMARISDDIEIHSVKNRLLAVTTVDISQMPNLLEKNTSNDNIIYIVSPQYLLLNFLYNSHTADKEDRKLYIKFYCATLCIIEAADLIISSLHNPKVPQHIYRSFVECSPFGLTVNTIGETNYNTSYLIRLANSVKVVNDDKAPDFLLKIHAPPSKYFPSGYDIKHPKFNYEDNKDFQRAGQKI